MQCQVSKFLSDDSGKHQGGRKGVASNSILGVECLRWVHERCSGIKGKLKSNVDFRCRRCLDEGLVEEGDGYSRNLGIYLRFVK